MGEHRSRGEVAGSQGLTRSRRAAAFVLFAVLVWVAAGIRPIDTEREFAVVEVAGRSIRVDGGLAVVPPGLATLSRYPLRAEEVPLPAADDLDLVDDQGLRYGFRGWTTVRTRPERWRELHRAAAGKGISEAVRAAVEEAARHLDPVLIRGLGAESLSESLEGPLTAALATRGLDLRRVDVDEIDRLAATGEIRDPGTRLLLIGLDGADWEILRPLLDGGRLPNLRRLIDDGVSGKLLTISPMLSPVIWTTIATGVEPSRHGILDFLVQGEDGSDRQPVTSVQRTAATMWQVLGRAGIDTGCVGWWATWPAEPVRGYLVADRVAYQLFDYRSDPADDEGKTWPPALYDEIRDRIVPPDRIPWTDVLGYLEGDRTGIEQFDGDETRLLEEFRTLLAAGETYVSIADRLRRAYAPRFEAVYLEGTDTVGHLFMRFRPPRLPNVSEREFETYRAVVDRYYETADAQIGRLLADRSGDWTVMIVSDHGFATDATRPQSTDSRIGHGAAASWHRRFGVVILSGAHVRSGVRLDDASVYDVAPTVLALFGQPVPRSWPGRVLVDAIEPEFLGEFPVRFRPDDPPRRTAEGAMIAGSSDGSGQELLEKLQSLGYVSASGATDSITFRNNSGVALMAEGKFREAEEIFRAGLAEHPGQPMLQVNLGLALRQQGRNEEARVVLERALGAPEATRLAAHHLAQIALADGDLERAENTLREVLRVEPDASELLSTLGQVLERRGRADEARGAYVRAAEVDPAAAQPRNFLGNLARAEGRPRDAERWYLAAIEADPYFIGAYNNLAIVYQDGGRLDEAIELYDRALQRAPGNAVVLNNLASLYYARGELDEAERLWRRAVRAVPTYPSPYNNLAGIEIARGRPDAAEPLLQRAVDLDPRYGDARVNLAIVHRLRREPDLAEEQLRLAVEDERSRGEALFQWGLLELDRGELSRAVERFELARHDLGDRTGLLNVLGEAYFAVGRPADAERVWQRSLAIEPGQTAVRDALRRLAPAG